MYTRSRAGVLDENSPSSSLFLSQAGPKTQKRCKERQNGGGRCRWTAEGSVKNASHSHTRIFVPCWLRKRLFCCNLIVSSQHLRRVKLLFNQHFRYDDKHCHLHPFSGDLLASCDLDRARTVSLVLVSYRCRNTRTMFSPMLRFSTHYFSSSGCNCDCNSTYGYGM